MFLTKIYLFSQIYRILTIMLLCEAKVSEAPFSKIKVFSVAFEKQKIVSDLFARFVFKQIMNCFSTFSRTTILRVIFSPTPTRTKLFSTQKIGLAAKTHRLVKKIVK